MNQKFEFKTHPDEHGCDTYQVALYASNGDVLEDEPEFDEGPYVSIAFRKRLPDAAEETTTMRELARQYYGYSHEAFHVWEERWFYIDDDSIKTGTDHLILDSAGDEELFSLLEYHSVADDDIDAVSDVDEDEAAVPDGTDELFSSMQETLPVTLSQTDLQYLSFVSGLIREPVTEADWILEFGEHNESTDSVGECLLDTIDTVFERCHRTGDFTRSGEHYSEVKHSLIGGEVATVTKTVGEVFDSGVVSIQSSEGATDATHYIVEPDSVQRVEVKGGVVADDRTKLTLAEIERLFDYLWLIAETHTQESAV